jgi:kynureninase
MTPPTRREVEELDRQDPLASFREHFVLPDGIIYLDGNSLGSLPRAVPERIGRVVEEEWGRDRIASWNRHAWIDLPLRVGARLAPLLGCRDDEVVVGDSVSVNLYKLATAALRARPARATVLTVEGEFPTDLYVLQGVCDAEGRRLVQVPAEELEARLDEDVALLCLSHVCYRTGAVRPMAALDDAARAAGSLTLWDLSHAAGALPVDLEGAKADLAVGCGYKYLNGGPGAPAWLYVARRHQERLRSPLQGWMGHARPFDFEPDYRPATGMARWLCGTPPILGLAALEAALEVFEKVDLREVRTKSLRLGELFLAAVRARCAPWGLQPMVPSRSEERGSQVAFSHPEAFAVVQALIARGVVGDFRAPDLLRFGLAPLYLRYVDVLDAVEALERVLGGEEWRRPAFRSRGKVT